MKDPNAILPLPALMVAPTGARRGKNDHPTLPISIEEIVATAKACMAAGADGLHAHVRDAMGKHTLNTDLYRVLLEALNEQAPGLYVQITTEAVGQYRPEEQRAVVRELEPRAVSISIREMMSEGEHPDIALFYHHCLEAGTAVQHILYSKEDIELLKDRCIQGIVPKEQLQLLLVLGRYTEGQQSTPEDLPPLVDELEKLAKVTGSMPDWALCAFGVNETACLVKAQQMGGKVRIGFENNLNHPDGSLAHDNADRVSEFINAAKTAAL